MCVWKFWLCSEYFSDSPSSGKISTFVPRDSSRRGRKAWRRPRNPDKGWDGIITRSIWRWYRWWRWWNRWRWQGVRWKKTRGIWNSFFFKVNGCGWCSATQTIFWPQILSGGALLSVGEKYFCQKIILLLSSFFLPTNCFVEQVDRESRPRSQRTTSQDYSSSVGDFWHNLRRFCDIRHFDLNEHASLACGHLVNCPTRWSLSLIFGFLWWSSLLYPFNEEI